jgi:sugar lactone lactonase YvrE
MPDGWMLIVSMTKRQVLRRSKDGTIDTGQPCFACMLGGEDGRTLFALTARSAIEAAASPTGQLLMVTVDVPHAARP